MEKEAGRYNLNFSPRAERNLPEPDIPISTSILRRFHDFLMDWLDPINDIEEKFKKINRTIF